MDFETSKMKAVSQTLHIVHMIDVCRFYCTHESITQFSNSDRNT